MKKFVSITLLVLVVVSMLSACSTVAPFADLPAPVSSSYQASYNVMKIGETTSADFSSAFLANDFSETRNGPGGMESDLFRITVAGETFSISRNSTTFGDVTGGEVTVNSAYRIQNWNPEDPSLTEEQRIEMIRKMSVPAVGYVTLKFETGNSSGAKILNLFTGCLRCVVEASRLTLVYVSPAPGEMPVLNQVQYSEAWGMTDAFDLNGSAVWTDPAEYFGEVDFNGDGVADADLRTYGFWQTQSQTALIREAMEVARNNMAGRTPTLMNDDRDSGRELIGRQTGLRIYKNGDEVGQYLFTYRNNFGHMPNTPYIGTGSLSRIERVYEQSCYAVSVINPPAATSYSTLYVFEDCAVADQVERTPYGQMYDMLEDGTVPEGVYFGIYSNGFVGDVTESTSEETIKVGEGGGVYYALLGYPTLEQIKQARGVISSMGRGSMDGVGFGYASSTMSGNGIEYYLGAVILSKCAGTGNLGEYGCDAGYLDRAGYMVP